VRFTRRIESTSASNLNQLREQTMADKGKGDKAKKEPQKKAAMTLKEKRKAKTEKKNSK
jgi:hypothetical protein